MIGDKNMELKSNYIINNNGKYDPKKIEELFINSKGDNIKYDYKDRREGEAQLFTKQKKNLTFNICFVSNIFQYYGIKFD